MGSTSYLGTSTARAITIAQSAAADSQIPIDFKRSVRLIISSWNIFYCNVLASENLVFPQPIKG
jgi:hypothetical protein